MACQRLKKRFTVITVSSDSTHLTNVFRAEPDIKSLCKLLDNLKNKISHLKYATSSADKIHHKNLCEFRLKCSHSFIQVLSTFLPKLNFYFHILKLTLTHTLTSAISVNIVKKIDCLHCIMLIKNLNFRPT